MIDIDFQPADRFTLAELTALWTRAYEGYFVPLSFTEDQVRRHIDRSDIALAASVVGLADGDPVALSLAGVRGDQAWIGGFGVAAASRRQGVALRLMAEQLDRLHAAAVAATRLEVIKVNPAREVYRAQGFAEQGEDMLVIDCVPAGPGGLEAIELDRDELAAAHAAIARAMAPTWRRGMATLRWDLAHGGWAVGVGRGGAVAAFAVGWDTPTNCLLLDAAAEDEAAAADLLGALAQRRPGRSFRLVDEPQGSPVARALLAAGGAVGLTQVEMVRG